MIKYKKHARWNQAPQRYAKARAQRRRRQGHPPHRRLAVVVVRIKRNLPRDSFVTAPFQYRFHSEIKKESSSSSPHPLCFLPVASAPNVGAKGPCSQRPYCGVPRVPVASAPAVGAKRPCGHRPILWGLKGPVAVRPRAPEPHGEVTPTVGRSKVASPEITLPDYRSELVTQHITKIASGHLYCRLSFLIDFCMPRKPAARPGMISEYPRKPAARPGMFLECLQNPSDASQ